mmetsp:Transcript_19556/g.37419  ORF Transcript_19556/g.37419 Transcript_19556/m.37419 type:complete len:122 (+) Transcript_19556:115-480(+)|eukprot:CAMPEP_0114226748 /NCGR_PEP_ID=MMETSP0058-20121206/1403_1 /TAXON_ID=36894 /ORGANISM="Pyramimonas parkeae, CCMP726" /LENGTH=121 /DNA_ID=CAMNT_0001337505 /DNA_START=28 /DNA_END=393 /DNA_ORIENTATION=-
MALVLGVGEGVFVLGFFLALCLVICFLGTKTRYGSYIFLGSAVAFLLIFVILVASPRSSGDEEVNDSTEINAKNSTVIERGVMMFIMAIGVVLAVVGLLIHHVEPPKYARPIDYRMDILRQ